LVAGDRTQEEHSAVGEDRRHHVPAAGAGVELAEDDLLVLAEEEFAAFEGNGEGGA
jgi:hypothetical protein